MAEIKEKKNVIKRRDETEFQLAVSADKKKKRKRLTGEGAGRHKFHLDKSNFIRRSRITIPV